MTDKLPELSEQYKYGFSDKDVSVFKTEQGLSEEVVREISSRKNEPDWMLEFRLQGLETFYRKPMQTWGPDLSDLDLNELTYYVKPSTGVEDTWGEVPEEIKDTFERLGVPEAEEKYLGGLSAQYESEVVYHNMKQELVDKGIIFLDTDSAIKQHPELVQEYLATVVPTADNKFSALNSAVWSGGSFVYVPPGVKVDTPIQAYFRINTESMSQHERTLIIVDEGSSIHYVEGCTAPSYSSNSLHTGVVEIIAKKNAYVRYTTIQNWSDNIYNLVTQRAVAEEGATVEWVDGNIGSKLTMKYPAVVMKGKGAKANILSIAVAGKGQLQDAGAKVIHLAPDCTSTIISKSICKQGGKASYRGLAHFGRGATGSKSNIKCDTLILDNLSTSDTLPKNQVLNNRVVLEHEATVSKVSEEQLFYLMSRGISQDDAVQMIIMGFIEPFTKELPMEYAVEMNRLINFDMEGSIG